MNTFEKCTMIRRNLLASIGEIINYDWSGDFCRSEILRMSDKLQASEFNEINPGDLTLSEMEELGFGKWSDESTGMLIPLWLYPFLLEEFPASCIDGSSVMRKSDMDRDHRFGCLAYTVEPKNTPSC